MPSRISITREAEAHLDALTVRERRTLEVAVLARLGDRPTTPTRAVKPLRSDPFAEFDLRGDDLRVLDHVESRRLGRDEGAWNVRAETPLVFGRG